MSFDGVVFSIVIGWLGIGIVVSGVVLATNKNKRTVLRMMPNRLSIIFVLIMSMVLWPLLIWQETRKGTHKEDTE